MSTPLSIAFAMKCAEAASKPQYPKTETNVAVPLTYTNGGDFLDEPQAINNRPFNANTINDGAFHGYGPSNIQYAFHGHASILDEQLWVTCL
ncbi:MAG: hypothetical protein ACI92O_000384 [Colwellia sp.]|jgi:hypothetical protein